MQHKKICGGFVEVKKKNYSFITENYKNEEKEKKKKENIKVLTDLFIKINFWLRKKKKSGRNSEKNREGIFSKLYALKSIHVSVLIQTNALRFSLH